MLSSRLFTGLKRGRILPSPRPNGGGLRFEIGRANGPDVQCSNSPHGLRAKVCTAAMSYINLPTVLPISPSKTRGQIQVRGLGWSRVVAGAGCATGKPLKMTSLLGDFRAHVLREKVMNEWAFGAVGLPLFADPGSPLPPPSSSQKPLTRPQTPPLCVPSRPKSGFLDSCPLPAQASSLGEPYLC